MREFTDKEDSGNPEYQPRRMLVARIFEGSICGAPTKAGRLCMSRALVSGGRCEAHARSVTPKTDEVKIALQGASAILGRVLGFRERATFAQILASGGASTLEDQIALCKLRIRGLEAKFTDGKIPIHEYAKELKSLWKSLKGLTDTQARLIEVQSNPNAPVPETPSEKPDAFDPLTADTGAGGAG